MKRLFVLFISLYSFQDVFGQSRDLNLVNERNGDLPFWYTVQMELCEEIGLDSIQNSPYVYHFRIWTNRQAVDIWKDSTGVEQGEVICWTDESVPFDEPETHRHYVEAFPLDSNAVHDLFKLIDSTGINNLPDQDSIATWRQGFDGVTYRVEYANTADYYFKSYWTPSAQDSLSEAVVIQTFVDRSGQIADLNKVWIEFDQKIPFECWVNGHIITCRILSRKEHRRQKRERKRYRKEHGLTE